MLPYSSIWFVAHGFVFFQTYLAGDSRGPGGYRGQDPARGQEQSVVGHQVRFLPQDGGESREDKLVTSPRTLSAPDRLNVTPVSPEVGARLPLNTHLEARQEVRLLLYGAVRYGLLILRSCATVVYLSLIHI